MSSRFGLLFLTIAISANPATAGVLNITNCNQTDDRQRLACYDQLKQQLTVRSNKITPLPTAFLESEIRVDANRSEYTLTVSQLLKLINVAVQDNGRKIKVGKWQHNNDAHQLDITIREKIYLTFAHQNSDAQDFSLLSTVTANGTSLDAASFIFTIAAMSPDEN